MEVNDEYSIEYWWCPANGDRDRGLWRNYELGDGDHVVFDSVDEAQAMIDRLVATGPRNRVDDYRIITRKVSGWEPI